MSRNPTRTEGNVTGTAVVIFLLLIAVIAL